MVSRSLWPSLFSILASRCWSPGSGKGVVGGFVRKSAGAKAGKRQEVV